jgi:hypothetical protein
MKRLLGLMLVTVLSAVFAGSALAQDPNTYLYIAHAASGRAVSSTTNPEFPVDVSVNGFCIAKGFSYGDIQGPFSGPAGTYTFFFTKANSAFPCTGELVFSAQVGLNAGATFYGVLSVDGSHNIGGTIFAANLSSVLPGQARIDVINATQATLIASISNASGSPAFSVAPFTLQEGAALPGVYSASISDTNGFVVAGPINVQFAQRSSYLYVLAGSYADSSVQIIGPKVVNGVF